jgi:hypothetical protein
MMVGKNALARQSVPVWPWQWVVLTALGAIMETTLDAALLQRKYDFFTGGFLSIAHLQGVADTVAFIVTSLIADAAVLSLLVGVGLWVFSRTPCHQGVRSVVVLGIALSPLVITNFFSYRLMAYIGDVFDLGLLFELAGGNPLEILAVSFPQLIAAVLMVCGVVTLVSGGIWALHRYLPSEPDHTPREPWVRKLLVLPTIVFISGLGISSAARMSSDVLDHGLRRKPSVALLGEIVEWCSDVDRDGYGLLRQPIDPAPFDPHVFPYAIDLPGNGIDDNGVGEDLPLERAGYTENGAYTPPWRFTPPIVFILLESFRADVIGALHHGTPVTPVLNALAARGISVQHAFSHNGYTVQSRHHLFAGSLANLREGTSLINDLQANGYQVAYFSAQDESFGDSAMGIGFDRADIAYDARIEPHRR